MKKIVLFFIIISAAVASVCTAAAQSSEGLPMLFNDPSDQTLPAVNDEMIGVLVSNLDNLFPITSQRQIFVEPEQAVFSDVGDETVVRMETDLGKRNIMIFANSDSVHDYSAYTKINEAYPTDFQLTMDVTVQDVYPESQGGCFIGFTNYGVSAFSNAEGAVTVQLLIDGQTAEIYAKAYEDASGSRLSLGEMNRSSCKLSILHLTEHTYVFVNGSYMGQYHDGKAGPFQMIYGATVFTEGDTANCQFDNMVVRKVYNQ